MATQLAISDTITTSPLTFFPPSSCNKQRSRCIRLSSSSSHLSSPASSICLRRPPWKNQSTEHHLFLRLRGKGITKERPADVSSCTVTRTDVSVPDSEGEPVPSSGGSSGLMEFLTSERVKIVAMLGTALALCNADRVVMSVAILPLSATHGWSRSFAGIIQSSFLWGYMMSPIAGGALIDRYGGQIVMAYGVVIWSLATLLTPWAATRSFVALIAMRVLLGIAEGVAMPSMNSIILRWFPQTERASAVGLAMAGFHLGSVIGLTSSPIIMSQTGVFGPFLIFGFIGLLWVLVWISATSSSPENHPQISKSELEYIQKKANGQLRNRMEDKKHTRYSGMPPFRLLLSKLPTWAIICANAMHNWGYFIILSWMPIYFNMIYKVDLRQAAWFSAVPWLMMAIFGYIAGLISDLMIRSGVSVTLTRKIMQSIGFVGSGISLLGLNAATNPTAASAWVSAAVGLSSFSQAGFLVNIQEIAPKYAGVVHGMSNTAGTFAAIIGTVGTGFFVELMGSFRGFLTFTAVLYFISALLWNLFSTGDQVIPD